MGTKELQKVLERIATWPEAAQEEALHTLKGTSNNWLQCEGVRVSFVRT